MHIIIIIIVCQNTGREYFSNNDNNICTIAVGL